MSFAPRWAKIRRGSARAHPATRRVDSGRNPCSIPAMLCTAVAPLVADDAEQRWSVREVRLRGEEAADLDVRIDPRLEAAEELEDGDVAVDDRRVALLGAYGARRQLGEVVPCRTAALDQFGDPAQRRSLRRRCANSVRCAKALPNAARKRIVLEGIEQVHRRPNPVSTRARIAVGVAGASTVAMVSGSW